MPAYVRQHQQKPPGSRAASGYTNYARIGPLNLLHFSKQTHPSIKLISASFSQPLASEVGCVRAMKDHLLRLVAVCGAIGGAEAGSGLGSQRALQLFEGVQRQGLAT